MTGPDRFRLLGLAPARAGWFRSVAVWATSGALPAEFVKCVSAEEVRTRLATHGAYSALVADAALPAVDRDLVATATAAGCSVIVVADPRVERDWVALGATRLLRPDFGRDDLVAALDSCARQIRRGTVSTDDLLAPPSPPGWKASLVAVTGPGGTGASVTAMAMAQGLADDVRHGGQVLLADLRLRAEQTMLHDLRDVGPGIQELVEAHRVGQVTGEEARRLAFAIENRRYHLMAGLRQARFWPALRPRSFEAALDTLRRSYRVVVCDIDCDLEGEEASGSIDLEERNVMSRTAAAAADVVVAVGRPSLKGLHSLVRVVTDLCAFGVGADQILPVFTRSPRSPRARARLGRALHDLTSDGTGGHLTPPVYIPALDLEECLRDSRRLPASFAEPLAAAFTAIAQRNPEAGHRGGAGRALRARVRPGSLGRWADGHDHEVEAS